MIDFLLVFVFFVAGSIELKGTQCNKREVFFVLFNSFFFNFMVFFFVFRFEKKEHFRSKICIFFIFLSKIDHLAI